MLLGVMVRVEQLNATVKPALAADLPVTIIKAKNDKSDKFLLYLSGDGGWNSFTQKLADSYAAEGINVIGLNSFKYFWKKKTPQQAANDISELLTRYASEWHKEKIIICGFSFGADVAPFIYSRLPETVRGKVVLMQLISPSAHTDFEIHLVDMLGSHGKSEAMDIASEVRSESVQTICYYGEGEKEKPLNNIKKTNFKASILQGDHHYEKSYPEIAKDAL